MFGLVTTIRSKAPASIGATSSGTVRMVGALMTFAPRSVRRRVRPSAWARARVTAMTRPASGRRSAQPIASRTETTSPTTVTAGDVTPCSAAIAAIVPSVPVVTRWVGSVPRSTMPTGVSAERPPAINASLILPRRPTPIRSTSVPPALASASQSVCVSGLVGSSWPVTIVRCVAMPRCVTGMPPADGAAIELEIPGTTS